MEDNDLPAPLPPLRRKTTSSRSKTDSLPVLSPKSKMKRLSVSYVADSSFLTMNEDVRIEQTEELDVKEHKILNTYVVRRSSKFTLRGRIYTFTFEEKGGHITYCARNKGKYAEDTICIVPGTNPADENKCEHILVPSMGSTHFILQQRGETKELMVCDIKPESSFTSAPRKTAVLVYQGHDIELLEMVSRDPKKVGKNFVLDFGDRKFLPSEKNTILQQPTNQKESFEYLAFRKVADDVAEVDCAKSFNPIVVFGIALSLFNSRLKA